MNRITAISAIITILFLGVFWYFLSRDVSPDLKIKTSDNRQKLTRDSINNAKLLNEKFITDSLAVLEQSKAFANIKFGINKKEFENEVEEFYKETAYEADSYFRHLGKYVFHEVRGDYYNGLLYYVEINGRNIHYDKFDYDAWPQFNSLIELLTAKYGNPQFNYGLKSWVAYDDQQQYTVAGWTIGNKQINLVVTGHRLSYTIDINVFLRSANLEIWDKIMQIDRENQDKALKVF